jgi:hypothetical protein
VASVDDQATGGRGPVTEELQRVFFDVVNGRDQRFGELLEFPVAATVGS